MFTIGGFLFLVVCVFGSFVITGGSMAALAGSLPFEMMSIGGAAVGTFLMANSMHDVKHTLGGIGKTFKGARFHKADYLELLSLLFVLVRLAATKGAMALEAHIEKPDESPIFQKFPKVLANNVART